MLTDEERAEIRAAIREYGTRESAVLDALLAVQRRRGWVSDELVREVAGALELPPAQVESVASYFSLIFRRPVGRHVILICDSVSCYLTGYERLYDHLRTRLGIDFGGTTPDGRFTLLPVACLGWCERAPAMMLDADVHVGLTVERIEEILARYP